MNNKKLKDNEYQCARCEGVFEKGWTDEEARQECTETFGEDIYQADDICTVCDDCYNNMHPSDNPDIVQQVLKRGMDAVGDINVSEFQVTTIDLE